MANTLWHFYKVTMMAENTKKIRPKDYNQVNIDDSDDLLYWTTELGASKEVIMASIKKVGTSAAAVRRNLKLGGVDRKV